jgi:hypothetical protein
MVGRVCVMSVRAAYRFCLACNMLQCVPPALRMFVLPCACVVPEHRCRADARDPDDQGQGCGVSPSHSTSIPQRQREWPGQWHAPLGTSQASFPPACPLAVLAWLQISYIPLFAYICFILCVDANLISSSHCDHHLVAIDEHGLLQTTAIRSALRTLFKQERLPDNPYFFLASVLGAYVDQSPLWHTPDIEIAAAYDLEGGVEVLDAFTKLCRVVEHSAYGLPHMMRLVSKDGECTAMHVVALLDR